MPSKFGLAIFYDLVCGSFLKSEVLTFHLREEFIEVNGKTNLETPLLQWL